MPVKNLKKYGLATIQNGYDICFIRVGEKRPWGKDWESKKHGPRTVAKFIEDDKGDLGVGIKTKLTPGVDIDCYDKRIVRKMVAYTQELAGETIQRTGLAPKTLLVYRADKPFRKVQSRTFIDDEGRPVKLEILGDGQQFVAFHTHPDTGQPYHWKDDVSVLDVAAEDLPPLDHEVSLLLVERFESLCIAAGWPVKKKSSQNLTTGGSGTFDNDAVANDKTKVDISPEELALKLHSVSNPEDYDQWRDIGMALWHQFDGADEGLVLWHEWSVQAHNYDRDALDEKWPTFNHEGKSQTPMTARIIIKAAKKAEEELAGEELATVKTDIEEADDLPAISTVCDRIKHLAFSPLMRENLTGLVKERIKTISGTTVSLATVRKMLAFENPEIKSMPVWMKDYVFCQQDETFYDAKRRHSLSAKAFGMTYDRYMMTRKDRLEGRSVPEHNAVHAALNRHQIPTVANKMYFPGDDTIFNVDGLDYVNSYSDAGVPEAPETLNRKERRMVARLEAHMEHLFDNERDRKLLLSWFAYIVQTGHRINWAPIVQGAEGDGKSFFGLVMGAVLGGGNANTINGDALAEKYSSWAENCQFLLIEEVRLHGADRWAVINKVKPYLSNVMVPVRRMNTDTYLVLNTVNYFLTTNHKDGVPISGGSSRYFPMFSRWQTKTAIRRFNEANPEYYTELHEILQYGGALRRFFLDYELHPEFNAMSRATDSSSLKEMIYLNQSEEEEAMAEVLKVGELDICETLLDNAKFTAALEDMGQVAPYGRAMKRLLSEAGFTSIGQAKIDGKSRRYWSQVPKKFLKDEKINAAAVREWLKPI